MFGIHIATLVRHIINLENKQQKLFPDFQTPYYIRIKRLITAILNIDTSQIH